MEGLLYAIVFGMRENVCKYECVYVFPMIEEERFYMGGGRSLQNVCVFVSAFCVCRVCFIDLQIQIPLCYTSLALLACSILVLYMFCIFE